MQKYELSRQTHKMTIVLRLKLYKILLYTARIACENTYDMRAKCKQFEAILIFGHAVSSASKKLILYYSGIDIQLKSTIQNQK